MNKNNNKMDLLGNAPVPQALMALGIPIMIGMLINALYNLVDAYFIGGLGESQMGAISIAFPLGQVVVGLGLMFGNGAASYLEKLANLAGVHRIKIHALRHSHASLLISMGENPLLIKERLGHEKIQTTLGTYGHLYPNTNIEIAKKLTGVLSYQSASQSIANYTSNQHTAMYHKEI